MKVLFFIFALFLSTNLLAETERELVLQVKVKDVMSVFRDKKDSSVKNKAILDFIKSVKPLCKAVGGISWGEIPESELKKIDKEVGVFIGGMSDYQIKMNADEKATLSSSDRAEIKRVCRELEKHSMN